MYVGHNILGVIFLCDYYELAMLVRIKPEQETENACHLEDNAQCIYAILTERTI